MLNGRTVAAVILAGGKGTRFRDVAGASQKVLWPVAGEPLIQHTIRLLDPMIVRHIIFNVGYRAHEVQAWVSNQHLQFQRVSISRQRRWTFLDAITRAFALIDEDVVIVCNADEIRSGLNLAAVLDFHCQRNTMVTLIGVRKRCLSRYRLLHLNEEHVLIGSEYCPERFGTDDETEGLVNGGIAVLSRDALLHFDTSDSMTGWDAMLVPLTFMRQVGVFVTTDVGYYNVGTREELLDAEAYLGTCVGKDSR